MAICCVALEPQGLEDRLIPEDVQAYATGGAQILVPVAEFAQHMHLEDLD
jgi:hypothetical protein